MNDDFSTPVEKRIAKCKAQLRTMPGVRLEGRTIYAPFLETGKAPIQFLAQNGYSLVTE